MQGFFIANKDKLDEVDTFDDATFGAIQDAMYNTLMVSYLLGIIHVKEAITDKQLFADNPYYIKPERALEYFKLKADMAKAEYEKLSAQAKIRAFTTAALSESDSIAGVKKFLMDAIEEGENYIALLERVQDSDILAKSGFGDNPWYWETVFRTNVTSAFNAGRLIEAMENIKDVAALEYIGIDDNRQTFICKVYDGTILEPYHPFWEYATPPNHFNCRSTIRIIVRGTPEADNLTLSTVPGPMPDEAFAVNPLGASWQPGRHLTERLADAPTRKTLNELHRLIEELSQYASDREKFLKEAYGLDDLDKTTAEYQKWVKDLNLFDLDGNPSKVVKTGKRYKATGYLESDIIEALRKIDADIVPEMPVIFCSDNAARHATRTAKDGRVVLNNLLELPKIFADREYAEVYYSPEHRGVVYVWTDKDGQKRYAAINTRHEISKLGTRVSFATMDKILAQDFDSLGWIKLK